LESAKLLSQRGRPKTCPLLGLFSSLLADKASKPWRRSDRFIPVSDAACRPCRLSRGTRDGEIGLCDTREWTPEEAAGERRVSYVSLRHARPRVGVSTQHKRRTTGPPAPTRGGASLVFAFEKIEFRSPVRERRQRARDRGWRSKPRVKAPGTGGDGWERAFQPACIAALAFGFLDYRPLDNRHLRFAFPPSPPSPRRCVSRRSRNGMW